MSFIYSGRIDSDSDAEEEEEVNSRDEHACLEIVIVKHSELSAYEYNPGTLS